MIDLATLKSRASLADIVSEHVTLTRRGRTLWARCPFHVERTASFAVHAAYWHCHGCGAGGDVIDFTARINGIGKGRAIRLLAERYGVEIGPCLTPRESAYMRDMRARAEFWWAERRAAALTALEVACARYFAGETDVEPSGRYLLLLDGISPAVRGRAFLALRTAADNRAWDTHQRMARQYDGLRVSDWLHELLTPREPGLDPAEFVRVHGGEAYRARVDAAVWVPNISEVGA